MEEVEENEWGSYNEYQYDDEEYEDYGSFRDNMENCDPIDETPILLRYDTSDTEMTQLKFIPCESQSDKQLHNIYIEKMNETGNIMEEYGIDRKENYNQLKQARFIIETLKSHINDNFMTLIEKYPINDEKSQKMVREGQETCLCCYEDYDQHELYSLQNCSHKFCQECYLYHIEEKINQGPLNALNMTCVEQGCKNYIREEMMNKVSLDKFNKKKYLKFLQNDFVESYPSLLFCKAPDCELVFYVAEKWLTKSLKLPAKDVICTCGFQLCLQCHELGHEPLLCNMYKSWVSKFDEKRDKLNALWKMENSKKCPNCNTDIEKNQGCNRIHCKCNYQFCWLCMNNWSVHGYNPCNLYKEKPECKEFDEDKRTLVKLQFYMERYAEHKISFEKIIYEYKKNMFMFYGGKSDKTVKEILEKQPNAFDFYFEVFRMAIRARSFIMCTYPLASSIVDKIELELFGATQWALEFSLENLNAEIRDNPLMKLISVNNDEAVLSQKYGETKLTLMNLRDSLENQFINAEKEFKSKKFRDKLDIKF